MDFRACHPSPAPSVGTLLAGLAAVLLPAVVAAQSSTYVTQGRLSSVFPAADRFAEKEGDPPVYRAFGTDPATGQEAFLGVVFLTGDVPPEREGYNAPIDVLVGLDLDGDLTGVRVMSYRESLRGSRGDFLGRPGVQGQFRGKSIRDRFRVRQDVRNISGATITMRAMAEGIRNAARRVAVSHLMDPSPSPGGPPPSMGTVTPQELEGMLWAELVALGLVVELGGEVGREEPLRVSLAYLRDRDMVVAFFGTARIDEVIAAARERSPDGPLFFMGLNGPSVITVSASQLAFVQDGDTIRPDRRAFVSAGRRSRGKAGGLFERAGILAVGAGLDVNRPFTVALDLERDRGTVSAEYRAFGGEAGSDRVERVAGADEPVPTEEAGGGAAEERVPAEDGGSSAAEEAGAGPVGGGAAPDAPDAPDGPSIPEPTEDVDAGGAALPDGRDVDAVAADGAADDPVAADTVSAGGGLDFTEEELAALMVEEGAEESALSRTLAGTYWPRVISLLLLLALASWAFVAKKQALRWVVLVFTLGFLGFVDRGFLSVSHVVAGITSGPDVFLEDVSLLVLSSFTVVTTLLWGRVFCGYLCPFGVLQDVLERVVPKRFRRELPRPVHERALWIKYGVLAIVLAPAVLGVPATIYHWFEPFGTVFFWSSSWILWSIALGVLAASAVVPRFYCRYLCPLGAGLALGSLASPFRIRRVEQCRHCAVCERACPTGAIEKQKLDFKECVRCNACEIKLLEKAGVCRHDMEEIRPRLIQLRTSSSTASSPGSSSIGRSSSGPSSTPSSRGEP